MKITELSPEVRSDIFDYLTRIGDDQLICGHRLSEWCGHAPILEEDIALANIALDCIGHAAVFLKLAGEVEGAGRDEDKLAYFRDALQFKNLSLLELPNGDFAFTIGRQFLFSAFSYQLLTSLSKSSLDEVSALAQKTLKEVKYHLKHSAEWIVRLGDGTSESNSRLAAALKEMWVFIEELFDADQVEERLARQGIVPLSSSLRASWVEIVRPVLVEATLSDIVELLDRTVAASTQLPGRWKGSRIGRHTEHLGHLLAELQFLPRAYPTASW